MWCRSICSLFAFLGFVVTLCESANKVLLTDVTSLTLHRGQLTTGRRSAPVPQIQCVGGSAKGRYEPRVVQCYNRGYDGVEVQWECKADMSEEYEFGRIRLSCEGYDYPEDPYILTGSCGLKYELEYADGKGSSYAKSKKVPSAPPFEKERPEFNFSTLVTFVIIVLLIYVVYQSCSASSNGDRLRRSGWGWDSGPPPPPGSGGPPPPGFKSFTRPSDAPPTYDESCRGTSGAQSQSQSSGPGFFSGLGLGGLAGYMYGRSQNSGDSYFRSRRPYESDHEFWSSSRSRHQDHSPQPSTSRTASGFGGTERR